MPPPRRPGFALSCTATSTTTTPSGPALPGILPEQRNEQPMRRILLDRLVKSEKARLIGEMTTRTKVSPSVGPPSNTAALRLQPLDNTEKLPVVTRDIAECQDPQPAYDISPSKHTPANVAAPPASAPKNAPTRKGSRGLVATSTFFKSLT
ncbi:hypothetical protein BDZ89DRAFT_1135401 [Hymenopellis radicata]|nr:hypothetical protein BDZ89DRAFT_1135401 [Hymenopellis radicata]